MKEKIIIGGSHAAVVTSFLIIISWLRSDWPTSVYRAGLTDIRSI